MSKTTVLQEKAHVLVKVTPETIVEALDHLPLEYLPDVLQFIQFLEYKSQASPADHAEDEALWETVQANQLYKEQHPDEELDRYKSGVDFLKEENLAFAYPQMAKDECRELEALE